MNKTYILLIVFIFILFNVTKNYNVNRIYFKHIIIQSFKWNKKSNLRKLYWEEEVKFNKDINDNEKDSIKHCEKRYYTDYKYNIFYEVGKKYEFTNDNLVEKNDLYAVSNIFF